MPIQVALSVLVLQVFVRKNLVWLWIAIGVHAMIDLGAIAVPQVAGVSLRTMAAHLAQAPPRFRQCRWPARVTLPSPFARRTLPDASTPIAARGEARTVVLIRATASCSYAMETKGNLARKVPVARWPVHGL